MTHPAFSEDSCLKAPGPGSSFSLPGFVKESRQLLGLSLPIIISQLSIQGMSFVDTTMAGQASALDLAGIAVAGSLWFPICLLVRGILMALTPVISQHRGANTLQAIGGEFGQAMWIALGSLLVLLLYMHNAPSLLVFMSVDPEMLPVANGYMNALMYGAPAIILYYTLNGFCEGMANTRVPMMIAITGLLLNVPINYVLIYGKLGFPALGGAGCGWATTIVYWIMSLMMLVYLKRHSLYRTLLPAKLFTRPVPSRLSELLRIGVPIGINIFFESSLFAIFSLLMGTLGTISVASHQIALNVSSLTYMVPLSLSFGITIRVGHALGGGNHHNVSLRIASGMAISVIWAALAIAGILLFPEQIIRLYTKDPAVIAGTALLLPFAAIFQISDAIQAAANGALRGFKDTRAPMIMASVAYWLIALPLGYTLGLTDKVVTAMGPAGFWIGLDSGLTCAAVFLSVRLWKIIKRQRHKNNFV